MASLKFKILQVHNKCLCTVKLYDIDLRYNVKEIVAKRGFDEVYYVCYTNSFTMMFKRSREFYDTRHKDSFLDLDTIDFEKEKNFIVLDEKNTSIISKDMLVLLYKIQLNGF